VLRDRGHGSLLDAGAVVRWPGRLVKLEGHGNKFLKSIHLYTFSLP